MLFFLCLSCVPFTLSAMLISLTYDLHFPSWFTYFSLVPPIFMSSVVSPYVAALTLSCLSMSLAYSVPSPMLSSSAFSLILSLFLLLQLSLYMSRFPVTFFLSLTLFSIFLYSCLSVSLPEAYHFPNSSYPFVFPFLSVLYSYG